MPAMQELHHTAFLSTPSARRATRRNCRKRAEIIFLSTPSARRATKCGFCQVRKTEFLSTPSARRATGQSPVFSTVFCISIHALREEGDLRT